MLTAETVRKLLDYDPETGVFRWRVDRCGTVKKGSVAGTFNAKGYRQIMVAGKRYYAHRLAWLYVNGEWPPDEVDHVNCDEGDNRIANLRLAVKSENGSNRKKQKNNSSGFKGVSFHKRIGKFAAQISIYGLDKHLGYFSTAEEAHAAYCAASEKHYGEFARFE